VIESVVAGLVTGLITGVLSGFYSGLVVSRMSRFNALIRDAERALKSIDYMQHGSAVRVSGFEPKAMDRAANDLAYDKHVAASIAVRSQLFAIGREIDRAQRGEVDVAAFEKSIEIARSTIRGQRAHRRAFLPWGAP
jgi:hypothetical protein